jgi:hypothetical protein
MVQLLWVWLVFSVGQTFLSATAVSLLVGQTFLSATRLSLSVGQTFLSL